MRRATGSLSVILALLTVSSLSGSASYGAPLEDLRLADLPPDIVQGVRSELAEAAPPPRELLERILAAGNRYRFDVGPVAVETDTRWFATSPPEGRGRPILELRRWPGDSAIAFYVVEGETPPPDGPLGMIEGGRTGLRDPGSEAGRWEGTVATPLGERPAIWLERKVEGVPRRLGALLLPGDAGLGREAVPLITEEMVAVVQRASLPLDAWRVARGLTPGERILLPETGMPPGTGDERRDPWQVFAGAGFTLGLPPGILARSLESEVPPPTPMPGAALWLRGQFVDRDGMEVIVGDGARAGYVAQVPSPGRAAWASGAAPPLLRASATRVDGDRLDPLIAEWTGALEGRVEHFREPGWAGDWLVFRLIFRDRGVEVGLPVVKGWRSLALFWIPFTWRPADRAPAPPPIDPAERFGIRFVPLSAADRRRNPLLEGYLQIPGLRAEVPRGWWPVASLRTQNGLPVKLVDQKGRPGLRLTRLPAGDSGVPTTGGGGWTAIRRPSAHRAAAAYRRADGSVLFVAEEGHAFLVEVEPGYSLDPAVLERVADTVELTRR